MDSRTTNEKIADFVKANIITLVLILVCVFYVFKGLATVEPTGKTISQILIDGCVSFMMGLIIKILMRRKGIMEGYNSVNFVATCNLYGENMENVVTPNIDKLSEYCDEHNKKTLARKQVEYLTKHAVSYTKFLDGEFDSKPKRKDYSNKHEYQVVLEKYKHSKKARHIKIVLYTPTLITNAYDMSGSEDELLSTNAKKYESKQTVSNTFIALVSGLMFGYNNFIINKPDWGNVIWSALQVAIFLILGLIEYFNALEFITKRLREKIKRVNCIIDEFKIWVASK